MINKNKKTKKVIVRHKLTESFVAAIEKGQKLYKKNISLIISVYKLIFLWISFEWKKF